MRQDLRSSLYLLPSFPKPFMEHIANRTACGLAIIWRNSFYYFKTPDDLKFVGDTFDTLASFRLGRGLTFDGIASTIEFALPNPSITNILEYEDTVKEKPTLSIPSCATLQRVLLKYVYGAYEKDYSLTIPAMICIEKTYKHMVQLMLINQKNDPHRNRDDELLSVPDPDLWHRVSVGYYSMCNNPDEEISKQGLEGCQRHVLISDVTEIPDKNWIALLDTMVKKQAPVSAGMSRINSLSVIAQLMVQLFPTMTTREDNWKVLTEITKQVVIIADENMQKRRAAGTDSAIVFDLTVTIVTHLCNQLASPKFGGERRYCKWASDSFLKVLEKNGAADGTLEQNALSPTNAEDVDADEQS
jgi:hypothetical protein